jgi:hypothetical protein
MSVLQRKVGSQLCTVIDILPLYNHAVILQERFIPSKAFVNPKEISHRNCTVAADGVVKSACKIAFLCEVCGRSENTSSVKVRKHDTLDLISLVRCLTQKSCPSWTSYAHKQPQPRFTDASQLPNSLSLWTFASHVLTFDIRRFGGRRGPRL